MNRILLVVLFFFLIGCESEMNSNSELAKDYLLDKGYDIASYEGSQEYLFTSTEIAEVPHRMIWAVQMVQPGEYVGKEIIQEVFIVTNHQLNELYEKQQGFSQKVEIRVFTYNGEVIGGTSYPVGEGIGGALYSIDGKTSEEIEVVKLRE